MRFFVHVTPIGKVDTQSYCVEADSWQKALQNARTLRKEETPLSGFSMELTDDGGCRAVDPAARLRYVVKKAPDTAVLSVGDAPVNIDSEARSSAPQPEATRNNARTQTIGYGTTGGLAVPLSRDSVAASGGEPQHSASQPKMPTQAMKPAVAPVSQASHAAREGRENGEVSDVGNGLEPHVLYRREQEPTDDSPLLYREDVYVMPEGTTEAQAEKYLRAQFLTIKAVLASARPGKYVNLAVFDRAFEGRPTTLPLATLSWKDWKGSEPIVVHPRSSPAKSFAPFSQGRAASPSIPVDPRLAIEPRIETAPPSSTPSHLFASALGQLGQHASDSGVLVAPVLNVASTQEASHVGPPPSLGGAPPPPAIVALGEALRRASQPPPSGANTQALPPPAPTGATAAASPAFPVPSSKPDVPRLSTPEPRSVPPEVLGLAPADPGRLSTSGPRPSRPSIPMQRARVRGDELIAVLFEAMHDLHFSRDTLEASEFCLQLALENIPSRAAFAHFYDINKREYVIVATVGTGTSQMILRHHPPTDPLLSAAVRKRTAIVIPDAAGAEEAFVERFEQLGGAKSVIVAPVMAGGRALGAIELLNPTDGAPYSEAEGNAMTYMGEQFAEYVSSHGLVLDPERIRQRRRA